MKNNIKLFTLFTICVFAFSACEKALIEKPLDFLSSEQIGGASVSDANIYVNGALNSINEGEMYRFGAFPKVLELDNDDVTGPDWGMGSLGAGNYTDFWGMDRMWSGPYQLVKRANFGIFMVSKMTLAEAEKKNALGQLNVLKAYAYFLLVQAYGPVPLYKISLEEGAPVNLPRAPISEVYAYIIETLQLAETQLFNTRDANYKIGRISKGAASSLLAKVYLTIGSGSLSGATITMMGGRATALVNGRTVRIARPSPQNFTKTVVAGYEGFDSKAYYKLAMDKAKEVMDGNEYALFPKYMDVWQIANRNKLEHIWSMQALNNFEALTNGVSVDYFGMLQSPITDIVTGTPRVMNGKWYGVREHWYELFDDNDQRINEGVLHRWADQNGFFRIYPQKDSNIVKGSDTSPAALARRARYGYTTTDNFRTPSIAALRKFAGVTNSILPRQDFHMPIIRYADLLLMYAEANNEYNNGATSDAYTSLNAVVKRSNPTATTIVGLDQQAFRSYVLEERRRELALENNRRWDMIRWGIYLQAMNALDIDENNVLKRRQKRHLLYPIPIGEISANKLINENNPGW
jgi:hypothetical protein